MDSTIARSASAVHPERYPIVKRMAENLDCKVEDLLTQKQLRNRIRLNDYVEGDVGIPTLEDIMNELARPGRDPREQFEVVEFADGIDKPEDLEVGMKLTGVVTNVTAFGAFVDVGVHQDGLVHISQLADTYVDDPAKVVKVGQKVQVTVTEVDLDRNRVSLSMKADPFSDSTVSRSRSRSGGGDSRRKSKPRQQHSSKKKEYGNKAQDSGQDWFTAALEKGKR